jgi:ribosomal protein S18 acetylase RimI-like enzyme
MDGLLREPTDADLPVLRELYLAGRKRMNVSSDPATFRAEDYDRSIEGELQLVAGRDGRVLGFVSWYPPDNFVHSLFIDAQAEGQGIGRALMAGALARIGRPAGLKCLVANVRAVNFYRRQGWRITATAPGPDGDHHVMELA